MTSESVRQAAAGPDLNHRDPEYRQLIRETKTRLLSVYSDTQVGWEPFLLGGSGTLAVEAMVSSVIGTGPVLILENGYYSSRIKEILEIHRIPFKALSYDWLAPWDFDEIAGELAIGYEAVIGTHNETTTGRLNDIARLGRLSRSFGARCLIDAMSSFGADGIDFTNLDAVCASGNKCLHSIPGVSFVLVRDETANEMDRVPRRSYYMSLPMYAGDIPPLTPPVPALAAMRQALREMPAGGSVERGVDYSRKANFIRSELSRRGLRTAIANQDASCTLSTFSLPEGFTYERWFEANSDAGYILYGCKGDLKERFFQVSNMGEVSMDQLQCWILAVDEIIRERR